MYSVLVYTAIHKFTTSRKYTIFVARRAAYAYSASLGAQVKTKQKKTNSYRYLSELVSTNAFVEI